MIRATCPADARSRSALFCSFSLTTEARSTPSIMQDATRQVDTVNFLGDSFRAYDGGSAVRIRVGQGLGIGIWSTTKRGHRGAWALSAGKFSRWNLRPSRRDDDASRQSSWAATLRAERLAARFRLRWSPDYGPAGLRRAHREKQLPSARVPQTAQQASRCIPITPPDSPVPACPSRPWPSSPGGPRRPRRDSSRVKKPARSEQGERAMVLWPPWNGMDTEGTGRCSRSFHAAE